jgi:CRISPR-associated protein Cas2
MMRGMYVVSYDVSDPKRLRKIFRLMRNWGDHIQLSVFRCELSPEELLRMECELEEIINHTEDQALVIYLGPVEGRSGTSIRSHGRPFVVHSREATVV